jgi:hypothetical protein
VSWEWWFDFSFSEFFRRGVPSGTGPTGAISIAVAHQPVI